MCVMYMTILNWLIGNIHVEIVDDAYEWKYSYQFSSSAQSMIIPNMVMVGRVIWAEPSWEYVSFQIS